MALIAIGFSTAFVAISGTNRLTGSSAAHEIAMTLAQGKLDEVLGTPNYSLADDPKELRYGGNTYGFQVKVRPVELPLPEGFDKSALPFVLENVAIDVFWGASGSQQSYSLSTMRFSSKERLPGQDNLGVLPSQATQRRWAP